MDINQLAAEFLGRTVIELSHTMEENIPVWPTHPRYFHNPADSRQTGGHWYLCQVSFCEHNGTHVDAPVHYVEGGKYLDELGALQYVGRAVMLDMSSQLGPRATISVEMISAWEKEHGAILADDIVLFRMGYDVLWGLRGTPNGTRFLEDWPGLSPEGASYLVERKVKAVGTDAFSIDPMGIDGDAHSVLLNNNVPIIECLANLSAIKGPCLFVALPLKIKYGSGCPVRAIALV